MKKPKQGLDWTKVGVILLAFAVAVIGQSMDPRVYITETDPASVGDIVRGYLALDAWFNCFVENLPAHLQVRWQRTILVDGRPINTPISTDMAVEDNMKWSIEKPTLYSWRLRIKAVELGDEGNYSCYVRLTGNNNRAEANRTLLVTDPPRILQAISSSDTTAKEGDVVPLRCNASGRPTPTIIWRREGNAILPGGGVRRMGSNLDITNVQWDARGRYICEAFNEVGVAQRIIMLTIQHTPKLFPDPPRVGQAVGYQRTLQCLIDANPAPSTDPETNQLYWSSGSNRVLPNDRLVTRVTLGAWGRLMYELVFTRVESGDFGPYRCHARNSIGDGNSDVELYETTVPQPDRGGQISAVNKPLPSIAILLITIILLSILMK